MLLMGDDTLFWILGFLICFPLKGEVLIFLRVGEEFWVVLEGPIGALKALFLAGLTVGFMAVLVAGLTVGFIEVRLLEGPRASGFSVIIVTGVVMVFLRLGCKM